VSKRDDVLLGAFAVFAEVGYTAASVDAIAERAKVSVRTLYNHFTGKEELFRAVLQASAARVAEEHLRLMDRELLDATDLEAALTRFALAWLDPSPGAADHFKLMRRIDAERPQLPVAAVEAWRRVGPARVKARLAEHLARFAELGLLRLEDPRRGAREPPGRRIEVDLSRAQDRHPLALWLLACHASGARGRCRVTGLTVADLRFLDRHRWPLKRTPRPCGAASPRGSRLPSASPDASDIRTDRRASQFGRRRTRREAA